ncbi:type I restriction endonuclease subunit R, EcoR124 family, partial [Neisseria meningitidis]|uniref:type I restriction endonuclease subunit R, EcoR124 family n=1 Tax=Neisseria meningitidis TaxID=487 RepID=UPI0011BA9032
HLDKDTVIEDAYFNFEEEVKEQEIQEFANDKAYPIDLLKEVINEYEFSGQLDNTFVEQGITGRCYVWTQKIASVKVVVEGPGDKYG